MFLSISDLLFLHFLSARRRNALLCFISLVIQGAEQRSVSCFVTTGAISSSIFLNSLLYDGNLSLLLNNVGIIDVSLLPKAELSTLFLVCIVRFSGGNFMILVTNVITL